MSAVIWWLRRDLRLSDNQALASAMENALPVVPVFIIDPGLLTSDYASPKRNAFSIRWIALLDEDLHKLGSYLVLRQGDPLTELSLLVNELHAQAIFAEPDYSPYANRRDQQSLSQSCPCNGSAAQPSIPRDGGQEQQRAIYGLHAFQQSLESAAGHLSLYSLFRSQKIAHPPMHSQPGP